MATDVTKTPLCTLANFYARLGPDGLHPNDAGTQIMAMAFADLF